MRNEARMFFSLARNIMPANLTCLKVFIASPSGLEDEREKFRDIIQEFNEYFGRQREIIFQAVGWEETLGGVGRPQEMANEEVRDSDYMVLVLWNRWGTPSSKKGSDSGYSSGTEEEYWVARECVNTGHMRDIVVFFKAVDPQQLSDPGPQLQKVLKFREMLEENKEQRVHTFDSTELFGKHLFRYLSSWLYNEEHEDGLAKTDYNSQIVDFEESDFVLDLNNSQYPGIEQTWDLAGEGKLAEAEVAFSRLVVGAIEPQPAEQFGAFLRRLGRFDQAEVMFEGALKLALHAGDEAAAARSYDNLGILLQIRGELDGAERMHRKSLQINKRLGLVAGLANSYGNIGSILQVKGDLPGAENMHRKALKINEELDKPEGIANQLGNLGIVLWIRGDYKSAEAMFRRAITIKKELNSLEGLSEQYGNLGMVLKDMGDYDGAEEVQLKAIEIAEQLGYLKGLAINYGNLGNVLQARGDLTNAEKYYRKSLDINERLGRLEGIANQYGNLGVVLNAQGKLEDAEIMHRKALQISRQLGFLQGMAFDYANLGAVLGAKGSTIESDAMFRKALDLARSLGANEVAKQFEGLWSRTRLSDNQ